MKDLKLNSEGKVDRGYTKEWNESGIIRIDKVPRLITSIIEQRVEMLEYIEALHDKIDYMIEHNNMCDNPYCLTAGCTSDHK